MKKSLLPLLFVLAVPTLAAADSITITAGYIQIGRMALGEEPVRFWQLYSPDGFSGASYINTQLVSGRSYAPGETVQTGAGFDDPQKGFVVLNGVEYTRLGPASFDTLGVTNVEFVLDGPSVTAPPLVGESAILSFPFTMTGVVRPGSAVIGYPPDVPDAYLDGSGRGFVFFAYYGGRSWQLAGYRWEFSPGGPGPVPEPATLILVGSGLIGLAGWTRRRT